MGLNNALEQLRPRLEAAAWQTLHFRGLRFCGCSDPAGAHNTPACAPCAHHTTPSHRLLPLKRAPAPSSSLAKQ